MTIELCAPITASTFEQALNLLRKAEAKNADLIEFRLDYMNSIPALKELVSATRLPKIATNRPYSEGGKFRGKESERIKLLLEAARTGFQYVDIELGIDDVVDVVRRIRKVGVETIVSYHNFETTPNLQEFERILEKQLSTGADICKIVSTARELRDNLGILEFVSNSSRKSKIVSFAMGELGVVSRILSPIYGASFTFASIERGAESAAGQLTIDEVKEIYRSMRLE